MDEKVSFIRKIIRLNNNSEGVSIPSDIIKLKNYSVGDFLEVVIRKVEKEE